MSEKLWYKVARTIIKAGRFPIPINDTLLKLLKNLIPQDYAEFLLVFKKPSLTLEEIKKKVNFEEELILKILNELMYKGIIIGTESKSAGVMVYRLMSLWPGIFEYQFLRGNYSEKDRKIAQLFEDLFKELIEGTQKNYETIVKAFKDSPATDRTIPIEETIDVGTEITMPFEELKAYLEEYDDIALANCYCRHEKELIGDPCKIDAPKNNCFLFDKSAKFAIEQKFARPISKEEAFKIFREAEDFGLVHKVFHVHSDPSKGIEAICNCCKCCCGMFQLYYRGVMPLHTLSSYTAQIDDNKCIGCGTCVKMCPMETICLDDSIANINHKKCIGCGVCAHHCPEGAIHLEHTDLREVFIPPKKLETNII
jgi:Pyruvate/2-oxoacid:ferredoxin oxidoreductase delta subunit